MQGGVAGYHNYYQLFLEQAQDFKKYRSKTESQGGANSTGGRI